MPILAQTADIVRLTLKLCILLTLCRIFLLCLAPPPSGESYYLYQYIEAYGDVCRATLLCGVIGAFWTENCMRR